MSKKAGVIQINLNAGTAQFVVDMEKANAKLQQFGKGGQQAGAHMVSSMSASSAAIRTLEGNFTNNIRAAERFIGILPGMGKLLQAAFPVVGAIAFGGVLFEMGKKAVEFFETLRDGPDKSRAAFASLTGSIRLANDELQLANDRLANDIARMEGRHENTLKLALDEARISADRLAEALEKDLQSLRKVMAENEISKFKGLFTGQASTTDMMQNLFGTSGFGGFDGKVRDLTEQGRQSVATATNEADANNARMVTRNALEAEYGNKIKESSKWLSDLLEKQKQHDNPTTTIKGQIINGVQLPDAVLRGGVPTVPDQSEAIRQARSAQTSLLEMRRRAVLEFENVGLTGKKQQDEAAQEAAKLTKPYRDKLKELDEQLQETGLKMTALGKDHGEQTEIAAKITALREVSKLNKQIPDLKPKLNAAQVKAITVAELRDIQQADELARQERMQASAEEIHTRILGLQQVAEAIGKGYELSKKARVEAMVIAKMGRDYEDPAFAKDATANRKNFGRLVDNEDKNTIDLAVDKLGNQIELEKSLAEVQDQGADAIRRVTLAYKLRDMSANDANKSRVASEVALFNAQRANNEAAGLAGINLRIQETQRLTAAQMESAESVRQLNLELKYEGMLRGGSSKTEVAAQRREDSLDYYRQVAEEANRTGMELKNHLASLNQQITALKTIRAQQGSSLEIEISLRRLENDRLHIMAEQALATGRARDGLRAFFLDMQQQSKRSGDILYEALHSALDGISTNFVKLITGQKSAFGEMFRGIGDQILTSIVKKGAQAGLKKLDDILGKTSIGQKLGFGKPRFDGQSQGTALWVQMTAQQAADNAARNKSGVDPVTGENGAAGSGPFGNVKPDGTEANPVWVRIAGAAAAAAAQDPGLASTIFSTLGKAVSGAATVIGPALGSKLGGSKLNARVGGSPMLSVAEGIDSFGPANAFAPSSFSPDSFANEGQAASQPSDNPGPAAHYTIDARGTDPVQTEARVKKALIAVHGSAVSTSLLATVDLQKRTPQR
jgi:hypothetical protein